MWKFYPGSWSSELSRTPAWEELIYFGVFDSSILYSDFMSMSSEEWEAQTILLIEPTLWPAFHWVPSKGKLDWAANLSARCIGPDAG